jgi:putative protease
MNKEIGKVIHYFDKAMVAVIRLTDSLSVGDSMKFVHGESEFSQLVESMEIEHKKIQSAGKGDEVAMKVEQKAKEGTKVYKVE